LPSGSLHHHNDEEGRNVIPAGELALLSDAFASIDDHETRAAILRAVSAAAFVSSMTHPYHSPDLSADRVSGGTEHREPYGPETPAALRSVGDHLRAIVGIAKTVERHADKRDRPDDFRDPYRAQRRAQEERLRERLREVGRQAAQEHNEGAKVS
jgi:hypothetical protein